MGFSIPYDVLKVFLVTMFTFFSFTIGTNERVFDLTSFSFKPMLAADFSTFEMDVCSPSLLAVNEDHVVGKGE